MNNHQTSRFLKLLPTCNDQENYSMPTLQQCCLCGGATIKECGACGWAYYCDKECQTMHWILHQHYCNREYLDFFPEADMLRIVSTNKEQLFNRSQLMSQTLRMASGFPCCAICGEEPMSDLALLRFAGLLICECCLNIQSKMKEDY